MALPKETIDGIRRMYLDGGETNKKKIARMFGVSAASVYRALGKVDPDTQREVRQEAIARIAGKVSETAEKLVDDVINAPSDATYMQKVTAFGIMTDKLDKLDKRLEEAKREEVIAALPLPESVEALAGALRNEIRSVAFILKLGDSNNSKVFDEVKRVEEQLDIPLLEAEEVEVEDITDLDVGGDKGHEDDG